MLWIYRRSVGRSIVKRRDIDCYIFIYAFMQVAAYVVIIVTSLLGNGAVIYIVWHEKHMRTTTNYFIVNLVVCDVMVTSLCTWVHLVGDLTHDWLLGAFFCKFNSFAQGKLPARSGPRMCLYNLYVSE